MIRENTRVRQWREPLSGTWRYRNGWKYGDWGLIYRSKTWGIEIYVERCLWCPGLHRGERTEGYGVYNFQFFPWLILDWKSKSRLMKSKTKFDNWRPSQKGKFYTIRLYGKTCLLYKLTLISTFYPSKESRERGGVE